MLVAIIIIIIFIFIYYASIKPCVELRHNMRKLWSDHAFWTREYIIHTLDESPAKYAAEARLMRNQENMGRLFSIYYGHHVGHHLTKLLKEHITITSDLIDAVKSKCSCHPIKHKWFANANRIAHFLHECNDWWPLPLLQKMMYHHLDLIYNEIVSYNEQKFKKSAVDFEKVYLEIIQMSDILARGIGCQCYFNFIM